MTIEIVSLDRQIEALIDKYKGFILRPIGADLYDILDVKAGVLSEQILFTSDFLMKDALTSQQLALTTLTRVLKGIKGIPGNRGAQGTFMCEIMKILSGEYHVDDIPKPIPVETFFRNYNFYRGLILGLEILGLPVNLLGTPENIEANVRQTFGKTIVGPMLNKDHEQ